MNHDKTARLAAFLKAFNGNDVASTEAVATADFVRIFCKGPLSLGGRVPRGVTAACAAVVEPSEQLKVLIHFTESQQYQCGNRTFTTYRAQNEFRNVRPFAMRAVDIYTFQDGKLAPKDSYWKKITS